jgi:hypothetical protein
MGVRDPRSFHSPPVHDIGRLSFAKEWVSLAAVDGESITATCDRNIRCVDFAISLTAS